MNRNLLRGAIASAGFTQRDLALKIGMSPNSLSRKLLGHREFTLSEAVNISKVLNLQNPDIIFFDCKSQIRNEK